MIPSPLVIALEATLFGGPMTFISFYLFFIILAPVYGLMDWETIKMFTLSIGTWLAIGEYWRLAYATFIGERHKFGLLFWTAISGAIGAIYLFFELQLFKSSAMLLCLGAIIFATGHFIFLQLKCGNTLCPTRHSKGTA